LRPEPGHAGPTLLAPPSRISFDDDLDDSEPARPTVDPDALLREFELRLEREARRHGYL
jgi:hypothetical protein